MCNETRGRHDVLYYVLRESRVGTGRVIMGVTFNTNLQMTTTKQQQQQVTRVKSLSLYHSCFIQIIFSEIWLCLRCGLEFFSRFAQRPQRGVTPAGQECTQSVPVIGNFGCTSRRWRRLCSGSSNWRGSRPLLNRSPAAYSGTARRSHPS